MRIISGNKKSIVINAPKNLPVRPTTDKVKESLFNIIQNKCDYCSTCITVCPVDCIEIREASIDIDHNVCINCNLCVYICPIEVLVSQNEKKI